MSPQKQYQFHPKELKLKVRKSPLFTRFLMFFFALVSFLLPLMGFLSNILNGKDFHFGFLIGLFVMGLIGFYLLRMALWNTYGNEIILFDENKIRYTADYGWFKDKVKEITYHNPIEYSIVPIGYEEDNQGVLHLKSDDFEINCVTKIPIPELDQLVTKLIEINPSHFSS